MLIYSVFLSENVDLKVYLLVIGVLSLLWIVLASIVGSQDTQYHAQQTQLEDATMDIRAFRDELKALAKEYAKPETERAWKQLIMEAESVAPKQFAARYASLRQKADILINS
jgi:Tfp pilus assembly protein PilV